MDRQENLNRSLITAIKKNNTKEVIHLLKWGANPNTRDLPLNRHSKGDRDKDGLLITGLPALSLAIVGVSESGRSPEHLLIVKALLSKGADVNSSVASGPNALMNAVINNHHATIRLLLEKGADVHLRDSGFDITITNLGMQELSHQSGRTALDYAHEFSDLKIMRLLLQHGANIDDQDDYGETILIRTAASGNAEKIRFLLAHKAKVNAADKYGRTALMLAANSAYRDIITILRQHGADLNRRDSKGKTALMYSMEGPGDNPKTIQLLLRMGADASIKNNAGKTVFDLAQKENYTESIRLLNAAGITQ